MSSLLFLLGFFDYAICRLRGDFNFQTAARFLLVSGLRCKVPKIFVFLLDLRALIADTATL